MNLALCNGYLINTVVSDGFNTKALVPIITCASLAVYGTTSIFSRGFQALQLIVLAGFGAVD